MKSIIDLTLSTISAKRNQNLNTNSNEKLNLKNHKFRELTISTKFLKKIKGGVHAIDILSF